MLIIHVTVSTHLSASSPISCPPIALLMEVLAPNQALLWKNPSTEVTSTVSVKLAVVGLRMILRTDEKPLCVCVSVKGWERQNYL